jgi:hypothetical protein
VELHLNVFMQVILPVCTKLILPVPKVFQTRLEYSHLSNVTVYRVYWVVDNVSTYYRSSELHFLFAELN